MNIKDAVVNFFYNQGITIVTIQPEFKVKSADDDDKRINGMSIVQCLIGCQSLECAPKTCCSTNDLQLILSHGKLEKATAATKDKSNASKSRSLLSLNVTSLMKFRRFTGSTQDIMKKCASESHVTRIGGGSGDDVDSTTAGIGSGQTTTTPSSSMTPTTATANNSQMINSSIDELKETEFHQQCGERSEKRMPTEQNLSRSHAIETQKQCEDSSLLAKATAMDDCNESVQEIDQNHKTKIVSNDGRK